MRVRNGQLLRRSHLDFLQIANLDKDTDKLEENELFTKKTYESTLMTLIPYGRHHNPLLNTNHT